MLNLNSSISKKLRIRLQSLTNSPSRETTQTLVKWILFQRRYASSLSSVIVELMMAEESTLEKRMVYFNIVNEILTGTDDWKRSSEVRIIFGRTVLLPSLNAIRVSLMKSLAFDSNSKVVCSFKEMVDKLKIMNDKWHQLNSFQCATLVRKSKDIILGFMNDIEIAEQKRTMNDKAGVDYLSTVSNNLKQQPKMTEEVDNSEVNRISTPTPSDDEENASFFFGNEGNNDNNNDEQIESPNNVEENSEDRTSLSLNEKNFKNKRDAVGALQPDEYEFDFEKEGVPERKVDINSLQMPFKTIANMQIARDLRSDTAMQLSSLLSSVPKEVMEACQVAIDDKSAGNDGSVDIEMIPNISDDVLDLDLSDSLNNVRIYREIISKQKDARKSCIRYLIESRCQFGSNEAAVQFYAMDSKIKSLEGRKQKILDAIELEGLDFEGVGNEGGEGNDEKQEDFDWCPRDQMSVTVKNISAHNDHAFKKIKTS